MSIGERARSDDAGEGGWEAGLQAAGPAGEAGAQATSGQRGGTAPQAAAAADPGRPSGRREAGRPRPRARRSPAFAGLLPEACAFFTGLAADNTRAWFVAHQDAYRACVDRPWRALIGAVAPPVAARLPEVDAVVTTGHVLSRIQFQWPRPGAAYRTGLRATFAPGGGPRAPAARLFVTLDAGGVKAGAEVAAGTPEWRRLLQRLRGEAGLAAACPSPEVCPAGLVWMVAGQRVDGGEPAHEGLVAAVADRMGAAGRRGSVRAIHEWPVEAAVAAGTGLAAAVGATLLESVPLFLSAAECDDVRWLARLAEGAVDAGATAGHGQQPAVPAAPAPAGDVTAPDRSGGAAARVYGDPPPSVPSGGDGPGAVGRPGRASAPTGALDGVEAARGPGGPGGDDPLGAGLALLPFDLRTALARRAAAEGVSVEALVVYVLTRAAGAG